MIEVWDTAIFGRRLRILKEYVKEEKSLDWVSEESITLDKNL